MKNRWITVSEILDIMLKKNWELAGYGNLYHLRQQDKHYMKTACFELTFDEVRQIRLKTESAKEGLCAMH